MEKGAIHTSPHPLVICFKQCAMSAFRLYHFMKILIEIEQGHPHLINSFSMEINGYFPSSDLEQTLLGVSINCSPLAQKSVLQNHCVGQ